MKILEIWTWDQLQISPWRWTRIFAGKAMAQRKLSIRSMTTRSSLRKSILLIDLIPIRLKSHLWNTKHFCQRYQLTKHLSVSRFKISWIYSMSLDPLDTVLSQSWNMFTLSILNCLKLVNNSKHLEYYYWKKSFFSVLITRMEISS